METAQSLSGLFRVGWLSRHIGVKNGVREEYILYIIFQKNYSFLNRLQVDFIECNFKFFFGMFSEIRLFFLIKSALLFLFCFFVLVINA